MKPFKILLFMASLFIFFLGVYLIFPTSGLAISEQFSLKFITPADFEKKENNTYADISNILKTHTLLTDTTFPENSKKDLQSTIFSHITDTIKKKTFQPISSIEKIILPASKTNISIDSLKLSLQKIEYPDSTLNPLKNFFAGLISREGNGPIRIMHYGDSQIEGDRVSSVLRNRMHAFFGGSGPGLVPATVDNLISLTVLHNSSNNWKIFKKCGFNQRYAEHKKYGALLNFSRLTPISPNDTNTVQGWFSLKKSPYCMESVKKYKQCRIFCANNKKQACVELYNKEVLLDKKYISAENNFSIVKFSFEETPEEAVFKFKGTSCPDVYGIALDDETGIAVDNVAMRGSAGLEFTKTDLEFLKEMYKSLNVKLVILQFGVNIVPNVTSNYSYYEEGLYNQLASLKKVCPDLSILVVGVSDMSRRMNGNYVSYPNVELIRDAQKRAAFKAGCAFWDLYEAMGGRNSMPSWVFAKPQLARTDFTHFTNKGAAIVADLLYNAMIFDYLDYAKKSLPIDEARK